MSRNIGSAADERENVEASRSSNSNQQCMRHRPQGLVCFAFEFKGRRRWLQRSTPKRKGSHTQLMRRTNRKLPARDLTCDTLPEMKYPSKCCASRDTVTFECKHLNANKSQCAACARARARARMVLCVYVCEGRSHARKGGGAQQQQNTLRSIQRKQQQLRRRRTC